MVKTARIFVSLSALLLLFASGCPGEITTSTCSATTCSGCCVGSRCESGAAQLACGSGGGQCQACQTGFSCTQGQCKAGTPCTPRCTGQCVGADDGCGGTCEVNDCTGCCSQGKCLASGTTTCGGQGNPCVDCSATNSTCASGTCSGCSPQCTNKCAGASDGCGGACPTNSCAGCCQGSECVGGVDAAACGTQGAQCSNCSLQGSSSSCIGGTCSGGCTASCSGKCKGASDGCGGSCPSNGCSGCCDSASKKCLGGSKTSACGKSGNSCSVCKSDEVCQGQACITSTADPCYGQADYSSCSYLGATGVCVDGGCCTGCIHSTYLTCELGSDTSACGKAGGSCWPCDPGQTCTSGSCTGTATGACTGKSDGDACASVAGASNDGACVDGDCCIGCFDSQTNSCNWVTNDPQACGIGGAQCQPCSTGQSCQNGTCTGSYDACSGKSDGDACASTAGGNNDGECVYGDCCTGCFDSQTNACNWVTNDPQACGIGGAECQPCSTGQACQNGTCTGSYDACSGKSDGDACASTAGVSNDGACVSGDCCTGCFDSQTNSCNWVTNDPQACGSDGDSCVPCSPGQTCQSGACTGTVNPCQGAADGSSCTGGKCYDNICCTGCYWLTGGVCVSGFLDEACGNSGEDCWDCNAFFTTCNQSSQSCN